MKVGLFSSVKNEGPFILEWVAYHSMIGFGPILVYSNDSDDGTDAVLDALDRNGVLHHVLQTLDPEDVPQFRAAERGYGHPAFADADWLMWMDTDEFLFLTPPASSVRDLIGQISDDADGIAVNWLNFGDSGHTEWSPEPVTQRFFKRAPDHNNRHNHFKTLFRKSEAIRGFGLHRPHVNGDFRDQGRRFVNGAGLPLHDDMYRHGKRMRHALGATPPELVSHQMAAICHYPVKTMDSFLLKRMRGSGVAPRDSEDRAKRFQDRYLRVYNHNTVEDTRMMQHGEALRSEIARLQSLPGVAEAYESAILRYKAKLEKLKETSKADATAAAASEQDDAHEA